MAYEEDLVTSACYLCNTLRERAIGPRSNNRLTNYYYMSARMDLTVETPTATEYGVVRTLADGVFGTGTGIETVKSWGFRGGYTHNWSPNWVSAIYGGYAQVKYGNASKTLICANFAAAFGTATATCNPDFNFGVVGVNTVWTPVKNLSFTADLSWTRLDQKYSGTIAGPATAVSAFAKPAATYELKDQNSLAMLLRAQCNF